MRRSKIRELNAGGNMPSRRLIGAVVLSLLSGCAWVLPRPSRPPPPPQAAVAAYAACTLELTEARKNRSTALYGAGAARPLIISLADGPSPGRVVRDGSAVALRRAAGGEGEAARAGKSMQALIQAVGARSGMHDTIEDQGVVQLRPRPTAPGQSNEATADGGSPAADREFLVFKADTPNPNRPTSCDALLRDGDFVYLQSVRPNTWVSVSGGTLVAEAARAPDGSPCRAPKETCYTDRYGGMLCVNHFECADESER
jgi:hypothetical protein